MSVHFDGATNISSVWTAFKASATSKNIPIQYEDDGVIYSIFAFDGLAVYTCLIWKDTVPDGVAQTYSQAQNDIDKADFETNYKPKANKRTLATDSQGRLVTTYEASAATRSGSIVGAIQAASAAFQRVTRATYTEQSVNRQCSIRSSSVNDTAAGTGARTMKLTYYDVTGEGPFTETVTLAGTTWVNFTNSNICFIEKLRCITQGSSDDIVVMNIGTITLNNAINGTGSTIITIPAADGETFMAQHHVPPGITCYVTRIGASRAVGNIEGRLWVYTTKIPVANQSPTLFCDVMLVDQNVSVKFDVPMPVVGPAKIACWIAPTANQATYYYTAIEYYEEPT
jgi:hypothetical protein